MSKPDYSMLDNLIAERVMGWKVLFDSDIELPYYQDGEGNFRLMCAGWHPSECLDDALVVIEEACAKLQFVPWSLGKYRGTKLYWAHISRDFVGPSYWQAEDRTAQLALCICALKSAGLKEDEISNALPLAS